MEGAENDDIFTIYDVIIDGNRAARFEIDWMHGTEEYQNLRFEVNDRNQLPCL